MSDWITPDGSVASVTADDRGLQYGDGLFETIAIRNGKPRLLDYHRRRLADGCERLGLPCPDDLTVDRLLGHLIDTQASSDKSVVKLVLTAGIGPRGYARPPEVSPVFIGCCSDYAGPADANYEQGVELGWSNVMASTQPALAGVKSLNRLDQVLARQALGDCFEHLLCDLESRIICGTMSNVMLMIHGQLVTPDLSRAGVAGVMRAAILDALEVDVRDVTAAETQRATEIVLCNSQFGVLPVERLGEQRFSERAACDAMRSALARAGVVEP
ncbi:MAG: aminodeoxychorismate lyase [Pseudomonadota bacterium]